MDYKLFVDGRWVDGGSPIEVTNKYTGDIYAAITSARQAEVDLALDAAQRAAMTMADLPAHKRGEIMERTAALLREHQDDLARTIVAEAGNALKFAPRR